MRVVMAAGGPDVRAACWPLGVAEAGAGRQGGRRADVVLASFTEASGEEARRWAQPIAGAEATVASADAHWTAQLQPARSALEEAGHPWEIYDLNAAEWGVSTAWRKNAVLACKPAGRFGALMEHPSAVHPETGDAQNALKPSSSVDEGTWLRAGGTGFVIDPGIPRLGGPHRVKPCGHCQAGGMRETAFDRSPPRPPSEQHRSSEALGRGSWSATPRAAGRARDPRSQRRPDGPAEVRVQRGAA